MPENEGNLRGIVEFSDICYGEFLFYLICEGGKTHEGYIESAGKRTTGETLVSYSYDSTRLAE